MNCPLRSSYSSSAEMPALEIDKITNKLKYEMLKIAPTS